MLRTTIAGSLPKPAWLARPNMLWAPWLLEGRALEEGKQDAVRLAFRDQEEAGIDIVTDGEQTRRHFVWGFVEHLEGIDFSKMVTIGIRADRYKADVPTVTAPVRRRGSIHGEEMRFARAHTRRQLKLTMPGPMTIVDTINDEHYRSRARLGLELARTHQRGGARAGGPRASTCIQLDEPAFNVYMDEVRDWGDRGARPRRRGPPLPHRRAHLLRLRHQGQYRVEEDAGRRVAAVRADLPPAGAQPHRRGVARMRQLARAHRADRSARRQGRARGRHRRRHRRGRDARAGRRRDPRRPWSTSRPGGSTPAPTAAWCRCPARSRAASSAPSGRAPPSSAPSSAAGDVEEPMVIRESEPARDRPTRAHPRPAVARLTSCLTRSLVKSIDREER